jgi:hypothetical protein
LIDTVQRPRHYDIILQLDGNLLSNQRLEEWIENLEKETVRYYQSVVSIVMLQHRTTHHDNWTKTLRLWRDVVIADRWDTVLWWKGKGAAEGMCVST